MKAISVVKSPLIFALMSVNNVGMAAEESYPTAPALSFDVRFDAESTTTKWDESEEGKQDSLTEQFSLWSGRINIRGKVDAKTSYRIRYDMAKDHTDAGTDKITGAINYFYFDHAFNDMFYMRVGKQFVVTSSWEFNYNKAEAYHYSETFLKVPAFFETGAQFGTKIFGQTVGIQATNSIPEDAEKKGKEFTKGIFWYGNFADKLLQPIVSYNIFPRVAMSAGDKTDDEVSTTVFSVGTKVNFSPFDFDIYGGQVKTPKFTAYQIDAANNVTESTQQEENWSTLVLYGRYKMNNPMLHPFLKMSLDKGKVGGKDYYDFQRISTGVEWFPESERFWIHGVFVSQNDKYLEVKDGSSTIQSKNTKLVTKYLVGVGSSF